MKKKLMTFMILSFSIGLFSCKPTVDNYREAYNLALQKEQSDVDDEIYQKMKAEDAPKVTVVGSDRIRTK